MKLTKQRSKKHPEKHRDRTSRIVESLYAVTRQEDGTGAQTRCLSSDLLVQIKDCAECEQELEELSQLHDRLVRSAAEVESQILPLKSDFVGRVMEQVAASSPARDWLRIGQLALFVVFVGLLAGLVAVILAGSANGLVFDATFSLVRGTQGLMLTTMALVVGAFFYLESSSSIGLRRFTFVMGIATGFLVELLRRISSLLDASREPGLLAFYRTQWAGDYANSTPLLDPGRGVSQGSYQVGSVSSRVFEQTLSNLWFLEYLLLVIAALLIVSAREEKRRPWKLTLAVICVVVAFVVRVLPGWLFAVGEP